LDESEGEESENSAEAGGKRKAASKANQRTGDVAMGDDYDSEEDDEDFKESQSGAESGSGSGDEDNSDEEGSSAKKGSESGSAIDSGVDKEELAEMKKELARQGDLGKRKRRPVKD
jgi:hypothetical protein